MPKVNDICSKFEQVACHLFSFCLTKYGAIGEIFVFHLNIILVDL